MLIGLNASSTRITVRFRALGTNGPVERSVELSWEEAADLQWQLAQLLPKLAQQAQEERRRRQLGERAAHRPDPARS